MAGLSYEQSGVDYTPLDAFKRACQAAASTTRGGLAGSGYAEPAGVRGESAFLLETHDRFLAHVEEGLGTKNLVADAVRRQTGETHYRAIGIDTVATMVNDLITCGALPISIAMHAAVGESGWFDDAHRASELAAGFAEGCRRSGAVWGGGETPALRGIVEPHGIVLAGSAVGEIRPKSHRIRGELAEGDAIIFLASSGVQTNGLTLCRAIADQLPQGYATDIGNGVSYGEALLAPSAIYVDFLRGSQKASLDLHYLAHVTGHGWRKLMRLADPWVYKIDTPGTLPTLFEFLMRAGPIEPREAFATFNMGVGFAAFVAADDADRAVAIAQACGHAAWVAGSVHREGDRKAVEIAGWNLTFEADTLAVR